MQTFVVDPELIAEAEKHVVALYNESIKHGDDEKKVESLRHLIDVINSLK